MLGTTELTGNLSMVLTGLILVMMLWSYLQGKPLQRDQFESDISEALLELQRWRIKTGDYTGWESLYVLSRHCDFTPCQCHRFAVTILERLTEEIGQDNTNEALTCLNYLSILDLEQHQHMRQCQTHLQRRFRQGFGPEQEEVGRLIAFVQEAKGLKFSSPQANASSWKVQYLNKRLADRRRRRANGTRHAKGEKPVK